MNTYLKAHIQLIIATSLMAGAFIVTTKIAFRLHPISLNLLRFALTSILFAPFVLRSKNNVKQFITVLPRSLIISFFYCGYCVCSAIALAETSTINAGSIYTLIPLITVILSMMLLKQKLIFSHLIIYVFGMLGTLWVVFQGNLALAMQLQLNHGDLIFTLGAFSMSGYIVAMKLMYRNDDVKIMTLANLVGATIWLIVAAAVLRVDLNWQQLEYDYYFNMLYLIVGGTLLISYLYQKASTVLRPINVSAYVYLNPLIVTLLSIVIMHNEPNLIVWYGILVSAGAAFALQYFDPDRKKYQD